MMDSIILKFLNLFIIQYCDRWGGGGRRQHNPLSKQETFYPQRKVCLFSLRVFPNIGKPAETRSVGISELKSFL